MVRAVSEPMATRPEGHRQHGPHQAAGSAADHRRPAEQGKPPSLSTPSSTTAATILFCIYFAMSKASLDCPGCSDSAQYGAMDYTIVVAASASEPAPMRYLAPYAATSIGEYFRDNGRHALIVYDDLSSTRSLIAKSHAAPPGPGARSVSQRRLLSPLAAARALGQDEEGKGRWLTDCACRSSKRQQETFRPLFQRDVISITDGQIYLETDLFDSGVRPHGQRRGLSVSRVGGAGCRSEAMRQVAGTLGARSREYRGSAAFAQFGSDLDKVTQNQFEPRPRALPNFEKPQPQFSPLSTAKETAIIFAGTNGVSTISRSKRFAPSKMGSTAILIRRIPMCSGTVFTEKKALDDDLKARLKSALEATRKTSPPSTASQRREPLTMSSVLDLRRQHIRSVEDTRQDHQGDEAGLHGRTAPGAGARHRRPALCPHDRERDPIAGAPVDLFDPETGELRHPLLLSRPEKTVALIVVSGDKGFAGAFNGSSPKPPSGSSTPRAGSDRRRSDEGREGATISSYSVTERLFPTAPKDEPGGRGRTGSATRQRRAPMRSHRRIPRHARRAALRPRCGTRRQIVSTATLAGDRRRVHRLQRVQVRHRPAGGGSKKVFPSSEDGTRRCRADARNQYRESGSAPPKRHCPSGVSTRGAGVRQMRRRTSSEPRKWTTSMNSRRIDYLDGLLRRYVAAQLYHAMTESVAAEHAARMTAMESIQPTTPPTSSTRSRSR